MAAAQGSGSALLILSVFAALSASALAVNIPLSWNQVTDYSSWSTQNNVQTGDNIVFSWSGSHTADVVSQADYDSCNTGNTIRNVANGGQITASTTPTYVICGTPGHCQGGMKVTITASSTPGTPTTPSTPSTPSTPTTPTTPRSPTTPTTGTPGSSASGLQAGTALAVASLALLL